ncbi:hypothetical protein CC79DRAFT_684334 [Sarocladium strictum]
MGFRPSFLRFFAASALSPFSPFAADATGGGFCAPSLVASLPFIFDFCVSFAAVCRANACRSCVFRAGPYVPSRICVYMPCVTCNPRRRVFAESLSI